ncbi:unnamed protein product [Thlaspi arvense]|uniref:Uncharacterized protein n=1 Tax=Thlaspi arvense TaxID=13288 RepID=A0AAU9RYV7_THLAR|nr:unnamed protein product [Thlaspi arvense]
MHCKRQKKPWVKEEEHRTLESTSSLRSPAGDTVPPRVKRTYKLPWSARHGVKQLFPSGSQSAVHCFFIQLADRLLLAQPTSSLLTHYGLYLEDMRSIPHI